MSELREKLRDMISLWSLNGSEFPDELADDILNLPQIREGQYLYSRKKMKAGKPSRKPDLGHSIGTKP
jgi:hypothetical protein